MTYPSNMSNQKNNTTYWTNFLRLSTLLLRKKIIQLLTSDYIRLLNKPYVNEVTLRRQKPPLKCCQPLDFQCAFLKGLDVSILKIWSLQVKGLQSYQPSNFENDWTATRGSNPRRLADWGRGRLADFFLRPPTLTASNFAAL